MSRLRDDFATLAGAGERCDLGRAALAIARIAYPSLDPRPYLRRLDVLAAEVRSRLGPATRPEQAVAEVAAHLFGACGFRGNSEDYYDPRNSFLNEVLDRRLGIPISLSVVLIETAARLGLALEGVGFPGHFLVRAAGAAGPVFLDPFFGGRVTTEASLLERYRALLGDPELRAIPREALETTGTLAILARMLRNLLHIYVEGGDHPHALEALDLLLVLVPDSADEIRLRGLLYEQIGCFGAALDDFRCYLALAPGAPDAERIRDRVAQLAQGAPTIH